MEAFSKVLNDVHNKMYTGDILHREPSHVLLPEEEYPVPVVEFEEMFELMMVSKEEIQQDKKVYDMLQDVISCMRDTGMIDSYLRLVFTKGLGMGMIANKLISNTIRSNTIRRDDYETRIGKLLFIKKRIDIITSLIYKRDPFIKLCLKVAKYIQTIKYIYIIREETIWIYKAANSAKRLNHIGVREDANWIYKYIFSRRVHIHKTVNFLRGNNETPRKKSVNDLSLSTRQFRFFLVNLRSTLKKNIRRATNIPSHLKIAFRAIINFRRTNILI